MYKIPKNEDQSKVTTWVNYAVKLNKRNDVKR